MIKNWRNYGLYKEHENPIFFLENSMVSKLFIYI